MESEQLFRLMADSASVMIWISGTDRLPIYFNRSWLEFTGRTLEQEVGNGWTENVHPDDLHHCLITYTTAFDARQKFSIEYRLRHFDGEYRTVLDSGSPWYDAEGIFAGYVGSCVDITRRKQVEDALRDSEERYRALYRDNPTMYFTLDEQARIISVNAYGAEQLGYTPEELEGRPVLNIIHEADHANLSEQVKDCLQHPLKLYRWQFRKICKDGSLMWVEEFARTVRQKDGTYSILIVCHDITARKQTEQLLEERERFLQSVLDAVPAAVWTSNANKMATYINPWALRFVGRTLGQEVGRGWMNEIHPDDLVYVMYIYNSAFDTRQPYTIQYRLRRFDGEYRTVLETAAPRYDRNNDFLGYIGHYIDITDWKHSEAVRQETEERLLKILETTAEAVISVDKNQHIIQFNKAAENLFHYTATEVVGQPIDILLPPDAVQTYKHHLIDFINAPDPIRRMTGRENFFGQRKDGSVFPVEFSLSKLVFHQEMTVTAMLVDVTKRQEAEELLFRQNAYLTALHDTALGLLNRLDETVLLETIVRRAGELIGTPHGFIDLVLPEEKCMEIKIGTGVYANTIGYRRPFGEGMTGRIYLNGKPLIVNDYQNWPGRSQRFAGSDFQAAMGVPLMSGSEIVGVIGVGHPDHGEGFTQGQLDMLEQFAELASIALDNARLYTAIRRHAEDLEHRVAARTLELNMQKRQLETILQNVADAIVFADLQGKILYVNAAWEQLTGYTRQEALGSTSNILQSGETPLPTYQDLWNTVLAGKTWHGVVRNRRKGDGLYDEDLTIIPVRNEQGTIEYFVGVLRDVTESLKLQAQQERFVANAAHELRTPLTSFNTRLYLARKQPEKIAGHLDVLVSTSDYMTRLVNDLLDLSRFASGIIPLHKEIVELKSIIVKSIELVQPQADSKIIQLSRILPDRPLPLHADFLRIQQVMVNLLANAVHYSPEGGHVLISVEVESPQENGHSGIVVHVQDDGEGISSEHLPHIFQPFYRVSEKKVGTGLGLGIAKEIIERHDGEISVISSPGHGTRFTVKLLLA